jgi:hypothetical protein
MCACAVLAQATAGSGAVGGTVRDPYGDGIPDTTILIINQALGIQQSVTATDDGVFHSPALPPGTGYQLKVTRAGFVDWESQTFTIALGETTRFRIDLQADSTASRVANKGSAEIDNHPMNISLAINQQQIEALPVNQRRIEPLVAQAPAVAGDVSSDQLSILGQSLAKETLTDGIQTSNNYFTRPVPTTNPISLDAVSAVQVLSADSPAQYRDGMTGIVNTATHSGTSSFHGTAYEYLRLPGLTADGRYMPGLSLLHGQNQTGASVGGPVLSEKLFFFTNFEVLNGHFDAINVLNNPLLAASNCKATATQCAAANKLIQSQNGVLIPLSQRSLDGLARIDYQLNSMNRISLEAAAADALAPNGQRVADAMVNGGLLGITNTRDDSRLLKASWVSTPFASAVNELRIGLSKEHIFDPATYSSLSTGNVGISLAGVNIGNSNPSSSLVDERRYQFFDNYTLSSASHTFQLGFDWTQDRFYMNQLASGGEYYYMSLTNFAIDLPVTTGKNYTYFTQSFGDPIRKFPARQMGIYGQDTWKVSQKLTVNFGLRWEKPMNPQPSQINTSYYETGAIASPNLDLAPRIGAAYRLDDKTVVRGGFGFYFAPFSGQLLDALYLGNALYQTSIAINPNQTNAPAFPKILSASAIPGGVGEVMYSSSKLRNPHSQQYTVSIDRELPWRSTLSGSFISNRGYKLWTATDVNLATATKTGTYTIDDASGNKVSTFTIPVYTARNDTNYSHIYSMDSNGGTFYDAMVVELRKRMSHGLTVQGSYTWSHAIDDSNGIMIAGGIPLVTTVAGATSNRDSANTDQRQRLSLNAMWQPTFTTGNSAFARYFVNGWQLSAIATLASGLPETPTVVTTGQQLSGITPMFSNTLDGSGAWDRVPFLPVNSLRTGPQYDWNMRITRTIPITERIKGSLMFEVFNLLNSQWDTSVNTLAYTATSGVLKPVAGTGLGNAAVSYPYGTNARNCQVAFRVTF